MLIQDLMAAVKFLASQNSLAWVVAGGIAYWVWVRPEQQRKVEQDVSVNELVSRATVKKFLVSGTLCDTDCRVVHDNNAVGCLQRHGEAGR